MPTSPTVALDDIDAWVFDLDGVLTDTARLHEQAWTEVLSHHFGGGGAGSGAGGGGGGPATVGDAVRPFTGDDYFRLVDGELPATGVRNVLADRGSSLPDGTADDAPGAPTVWGLVNGKDARYRTLLAEVGPRPFPSSVALLRRLRDAGVDIAVVSASRHCAEVLDAAGLSGLVDVRVDGHVAHAMGLPGKPDPSAFLEAVRRLGVEPGRAAVAEDALAGVEAGRSGGFQVVVGVDRTGHGDELRDHGASVVVADLGELALEGCGPADSPWRLVYRDPTPTEEGVVETLCTLANGYVGTRGARPWARDDGTSYPGTYVAGLYNRLRSEVEGREVELESLVNVPNWLPLSYRAGGAGWLGAQLPGSGGGAPAGDAPRVVSHLVRLDLRSGILLRRCTLVDGAGRHSAVVERRLVSMADPHLCAQEWSVVPLDWSGRLEISAGIEGDVAADETEEERLVANRHLELIDEDLQGEPGPSLRVRTLQSQVVVALATRCRLVSATAAQERRQPAGSGRRPGAASVVWEFETAPGARATVEKVVAFYTSHDRAISEPGLAARAAAASAAPFADLLVAHARVWADLWQRAAIAMRADTESPGPLSAGAGRSGSVLDLHLFHLIQVASPHLVDLDTGVGARGLHGEGYRGHVFWDTLFAHSVLDHRFPDAARALLSYRSRRLPAARRAAAAAGHDGAMFPWQSGSDGRDETPDMLYNPLSGRWMPDRSRFQRHVGLAVAFCAWQHWQATGNFEFLAVEGAELIVEVARFFASLATEDPSDGRHHIAGVMGPDEFHDGYPWAEEPGVTDNAYTNVMTAWLLGRAGEVAETLRSARRPETLDRLCVDDVEVERWRTVSRRLAVPFHDGVISQFAGYERLEPLDLDAYRARYGNVGRLDLILEAEGDAVRRYQVSKQADVLMLFYLLSAEELRSVMGRMGYPLEPDLIRRTVDYYSQRVTHGSTLSSVVHAWVVARADRQSSWRYFVEALASDVADVQGGTTREGIHLGAMGGTADLVQRCYTGLELRGEALWFNPVLPPELHRLAMSIVFRGMSLAVEVDHRRLRVEAGDGRAGPVTVVLLGEPAALRPGQVVEVPLPG